MSCECNVSALAAENARLRSLLIDFESMLLRMGGFPVTLAEALEIGNHAKKVRIALVGAI